ncbi:DUF2332 domain-containing protein [Lipingzhangella sp. LS1_29]|uniref:DUF2332 domain-containing protein n=1 Tax=Lipingzhangella rawalii TaxID=2055835 RepID=A0ABU2H106_9ACTN|nr:DUF2332 domain-containing protein [Lipingzhangella rawalii]MDS1268992.1 DUF2332 domain-containing protein [Lipingzhangella rawalii]
MEQQLDTAQWYRTFAGHTRGHSQDYERLCSAIADDQTILTLLAELPQPRRQPNLLLASVRYHQGPVHDVPRFRDWLVEHWPQVRTTMLQRRTQTNEVGRCATLLPVLAALPQPLALIEVGASAGLCLYPDRYSYRYHGDLHTELGPTHSPVVLDCTVAGRPPLPDSPPRVAWRAGIDLNPLDVTSPDDITWLECLVWPGQPERLRTLNAAVSVARAQPPTLWSGDLNTGIQDLLRRVPTGATPVVMHTAVLAYLDRGARERFATTMREFDGYWISNESPSVFPEINAHAPAAPTEAETFLMAVNGTPVAFTAPHGQRMDWFADHHPAAL